MAQERKNSLFATPVVFRTPETGFGGGAAGVYTFYMNKSDSLSPPSQVQAGFAVTQERQFLYYLPFQLFWNQRKWYCYGELGHYDYNYFFFGVGTRTEAQPEYYEVTFTRVRLNALRKVWRNWYVGPRLWIENWQFPFFEPEGELISGRVVGTGGGLTFDPGLIVFNDLRDNVFFPRKGSYLELTTQHAGGAFGFSRYRADVRVYHSIHDHLVWANELFIDHTTGEVPFYMMPMLGGTKRMRGYYEGRFRDQNAALLQTELRARIWRRWGVNAFYSVGMVAQSTKQFMINRTQGAGGAGLRFVLDREKDLNLRFDVAWGRQSTLFYFTVGEAF
jgi:hypothetical protein